MEWQPIETAPSDTVLELGWWEKFDTLLSQKKVWRTEFRVAWETERFIFWKIRRRIWRSEATHWRYPPPPPSDPAPVG